MVVADSATPRDVPAWTIAIDVGGTFTDVVAVDPAGRLRTGKVLSSGQLVGPPPDVDPELLVGWTRQQDGSPVVAKSEGQTANRPETDILTAETVRDIAATDRLFTGESSVVVAIRLLTGTPIGQSPPAVDLRLGTTRGTNALLEREGSRVGLVVTAGFGDALVVGTQARPDLFALDIVKPDVLTHAVVELAERVAADGTVLRCPTDDEIDHALAELRAAGCESLAIGLLHGAAFPDHEHRVAARADAHGFATVTLAGEASASPKFLPRLETAVLDAYLAPVLRTTLREIAEALPGSSLRLMTSAGTLVQPAAFRGAESVLSGPAGGVIGTQATLRAATESLTRQLGRPVGGAIGFDMGGTSTDVSRCDRNAGPAREMEAIKAGLQIAIPTLAIDTVAAGGGSICRTDGRRLQVGPRSAGANPGPACYGRGGPLTVTDCNVVLGRLDAEAFPFPLDNAAVAERLDAVLTQLPESDRPTGSPKQQREALAAGFLDVANEAMAAAAAGVSLSQGHDPAGDVLVAFGAAAGQHACAIAERLGCPAVLVPPLAGLLSAVGIAEATAARTVVRGVGLPFATFNAAWLDETAAEAREQLADDEAETAAAVVDVRLQLRARGTDGLVEVEAQPLATAEARFVAAYRTVFGSDPTGPAEVVAIVATASIKPPPLAGTRDEASRWRATHEDGRQRLSNAYTSVIVPTGWRVDEQPDGTLLLLPGETRATSPAERLPAVQLQLDCSRFRAIAERAGQTLRRTSRSPNVKERLDFSVALFDAGGDLIVNAPHIPVHLGAMGETVRHVLAAGRLQVGDVVATNDPARGGSHLPDVTVVTPVLFDDEREFVVASRAHHAEIGGTRPGSLPTDARTLAEEGVLLRDVRLVEAGRSRLGAVRTLLADARYPSRTPDDNLADLSAQIAANQQAVDDLQHLLRREGPANLQAAVRRMRTASREATQAALRRHAKATGRSQWSGRDQLDDGSAIVATLSLEETGCAVVDFDGTAGVAASNLNAARGITTAAVLYTLRLLVGRVDADAATLPLNAGVLDAVELRVPPGLLNPFAGREHEPADRLPPVVGGNTETSQRLVDVLLSALELAACSQGTMNNLTLGDATFGYYETIGGGSGATATAAGASGVQVHMTNTRMTDAELLECRLPLRVHRFGLRTSSGGEGTYRGGDGLVRELEFLQPLEVTLLTGRRTTRPPGSAGGGDGAAGRNILIREGQPPEHLPWQVSLAVAIGDRLRIETPGGGGWGAIVANNATGSR